MGLYVQGTTSSSGQVDEVVDVIARGGNVTNAAAASSASSSASAANAGVASLQSSKIQHLAASSSSFSGTVSSGTYVNAVSVSQASQGVVIVLCTGQWQSGTIAGAIPHARLVDGNGSQISTEAALISNDGSNIQSSFCLCAASTTGSAALQVRANGTTTLQVNAQLVLIGGITT